jgi:hypothetical protein
VLIPQFGPSDLTKIPFMTQGAQATAKDWLSSVAPWFKAPAEIAMNRNAFTDTPIDSGKPIPVGGPGGAILGALGLTSATSRSGTAAEGINPWLAYALKQTGPITNEAVFSRAPTAQASRGKNLDLLSYVGGLSVYNRNLEQETVAAQLEFNDQVSTLLRNMRDAGAFPPVKERKESPYQKKLIAALGGGGG